MGGALGRIKYNLHIHEHQFNLNILYDVVANITMYSLHRILWLAAPSSSSSSYTRAHAHAHAALHPIVVLLMAIMNGMYNKTSRRVNILYGGERQHKKEEKKTMYKNKLYVTIRYIIVKTLSV